MINEKKLFLKKNILYENKKAVRKSSET